MKHYMRLAHVIACITWTGSCGFPRPADVGDDGGSSICTPNQALRCDSSDLVRCNSDGTAEVREGCSLGCSTTGPHCNDINPSNGLAPYLDMAGGELNLDLGTSATVNTDDGTIVADGQQVIARSMTMAQVAAPTIRIFIVHSLKANDVTIAGSNAFAVVSNSDLLIGGVFAASAKLFMHGPGAFNDGTCQGAEGGILNGGAVGGTGGGGFGSSGGRGGSATNINGTAAGGTGGTTTGNPMLVPLRGGCDSGTYDGGSHVSGSGGGAMQLVSRTKITVSGVVAANGSSGSGGGSGGGILLEAPIVEMQGSLVANGGGGAGGCFLPKVGEDGRLDATPAAGGDPCDTTNGKGGNGGTGYSGAGDGASTNVAVTGQGITFAGHGGGGVGRIRVNTIPGGFHRNSGLFSPTPSTEAIAIR